MQKTEKVSTDTTERTLGDFLFCLKPGDPFNRHASGATPPIIEPCAVRYSGDQHPESTCNLHYSVLFM